ncbi:alpha-glucan phosphorylase [Desulfarculus baarsii DSM 2075]|uniref:Alpha-glucan phosphorylase n=1 Tax=Desulfarculus baarsii (strain ATCC 33931 / DSM 2075 / LMG 7858 / VKM B-1802 / 2st14) TaxID=644282 RepID=E1QKF1_DESB2|nr:alpha-glucan family phosphorylase [Desulfarculus baarsii]ADK86044.1 alpha-glucan phosphorylase [Desulfarculus baarsii DSM 2075]
MRPTISFEVRPKLPPALEPLKKLASNLWFVWNPEAQELWQRIDVDLWRKSRYNPVALLNQVHQERLASLAEDGGFIAQMERAASQLSQYMSTDYCPFLGGRAPENFTVAYFSAEYGMANCLPIYSGGLGMLSGDHLKSASDLNIPLVGVGLAYRQGYFTQYLDHDGWQQEEYAANDFWNMPMKLLHDDQGQEIRISVDIEGRPLIARAWRIDVGRVPLYLLDSGIEENPPDLRDITFQLYGGDTQMRIRQEILLGIGGVRLLDKLGITYSVIHMNEGHSAFAALERIRLLRQKHGLNFDQAREIVRATGCFTTHTPVPAGNDYFDTDLVRRHFQGYVGELGISMPVLLGYGRVHPTDQNEPLCMTVLALRLSAFNNGVSELHGQVSRQMWKDVWPHFPEEDVPIGHITNGVHTSTWINPDIAYLYNRYLGPGWMEDPDSDAVWQGVDQIPDSELWQMHERRRAQMVSEVRQRLVRQFKRRGGSARELAVCAESLRPDRLTIVFARRFATYKRAVLLLYDIDRLAAIVNHPERPVQFIFAGKAHPKDNEGKEFIRRIVNLTHDERFRGKIVFVEDYDMGLARYLVQGADVWLNNPRRPLEACGTSGMKAAANGALNLSVLDGWWAEAFQPGIGWQIGQGEEYEDEGVQNMLEAGALYRLLENDVPSMFYYRDDQGLPREWIKHMKNCLRVVCPAFNSHRMVEDYVEMAYLPGGLRYAQLSRDDFAGARELGGWVSMVMENWSQVQVQDVTSPIQGPLTWGQEVEVRAKVRLGQLTPSDVVCDIYTGQLGPFGLFTDRRTFGMQPESEIEPGLWLFKGSFACDATGRMGLRVRLAPYHAGLGSKYSLGLAAWG